MKDELADRKRKDVIIPHLKASFATRRDYVLPSEENNGYDDIISHYPALKEPYGVSLYMHTIESRNYTPFVDVSIGQNDRGLVRGIVIFTCDNHYRPTNATWVRNLCTFSGCLMGKTRGK